MIELAIVTDEIALDLEDAIRHGREFGIKKYEIRCIKSYEKRVPFIDAEDLNRVRELVDEGSIEITALSPGTFKINPSDKERLQAELEETLPKTFELATELGAEKVITFGFMRDETDEHTVVRLLKQAGELAAEHGVLLAVENEPGSYCDTGENTARVIQAVNHGSVGVNWDPGNALSSGDVAYPLGYEAIKPYLMNLHIKDTIPVPPDKWENRLINDGGVNWLGQLKAVLDDGILSYLTLETHVFPLLESTREDLRRLNILFEAIEKLDT
jgi:sugar phosphate isomerase/epimerase